MGANELRALLAHKRSLLPPGTTALRWHDFELDGLDDVSVDLFGDVAVLSLYDGWPPEREAELAQQLFAAGQLTAVYVKRRPKEAKRQANEQGDRLAPVAPLLGNGVDALTISENGVQFEIRPPNGLSVGLYLDARDARAWVRAHAAQKSVLNLFAYTCGFGLLARLGGARRAVNVDLSRKVLDWGRRNYELNGVSTDDRDFIAGDSFDWLKRFAKKGDVFDLIVLDPPSFATSSKSRFLAGKDYPRLVQAAVSALAPGGTVVACCNLATAAAPELDLWVKRGGLSLISQRFGASPVDYRQPSALKVAIASR